MTIRKVSTILGTVGIALGITLTLLTVFASAQTAAIPQNTALNFEGKSMLKADISAVQGISLTFPGGPWPWYAHQAISIHPEPPIPGHPAEICAEVENHHPTEARVAHLRFGVSGLGIGVGYPPVGTEDVIVPPNGIARGCTVWVPPHPGKWGLEVLLFQDGVDDPERKLHNLDVDEPLRPFQSHSFVFPVINPFDRPVVITLGLVPHLPDWALELSQDVLLDMGPHEERLVVLTVTMPITVPPDGHPIVDVEGWVDGENIGGFRKIFRYPVPLHRFPDPSYAEGEISVYPYPVREGEPTEICVELYNPTPFEQTVLLEFSWAEFGIGLPFHPINGTREVTIPPYSMIRECVHWIPPVNGQVCLQVELFMEGFPPQWSRRNLDVDEPLKAETPHSRTFMVGNPLEEPVTITLGLIPHLPDWGLELSPDTLFNVQPGETKTFTLTVTPPADLPPDGEPIVDVEAYIGEYLLGGFRKIFRPPIRLHPFPDPPYAEREITIQPYPLLAGEPTEICVELRNPTDQPQDVVLHFSWAIFGIGLPFHPIDGPRVVHLPPYSVVRECIHWIPPVDGQVCFQVELDMDGYPPQRSRLNLDVDEPLEPGVPHTRLIEVGNPFDHPVTITLGTIIHLPEWGASLSEDILLNMGVGEVRPVFLTVTPTLDLPPDEEPVVDVEAFVDGELIGGFRKIFRPPVPIHRPMDPIYAESEIYIHPYPPRNREPTLVGAEIRNPTDDPQTVTVTFRAADFGIGLPFVIIHPPLVIEVPPHGLAHPEIMWVPPHGGLWCIQVDLQMEGVDDIFFSQRNIDVGEPLEPGIPHSRPFEVGNPYNEPVTLTLGIIPHLPGWDIELSQDVLPNMEPGEVREVILTVTPGDELPEDEHPVVDVEAYVDGALVGGFRKIYRPPVPIHRPKDPIYAESEIGVDPYPVLPGQPVELSVEVFNPTEIDRIVTATFSVAPFGIGLPFSSAHITPGPILIFIPAHGAARGHVMWQPPNWHGKFCVRVELDIGGHESFWSQRNIDVGEPLEPGVSHSLVFEVGTWPYTEPVTITLGLVKHRPWDISLSERILYNVIQENPSL
ncbi:MAG: hypothetical protein KKD28_04595 [Chloroflexi bacterium]|nr:hypothetical protein [Chloroflexota bacterium]